VPLVVRDATSLTGTGYIGDDVESLLYRLIQEAGGDIEVAQRGIVYIDEIDKLRMSGTGGKDMRLGVQHALLKMLEGTVATVPPAGGWKYPMHPLQHDPRAVHLRRRVRGVGGHHRQATRAGRIWISGA
jgi:ATP-dependent Clp protease ATP-binding subunit ClpX